MSKRLLVVDDHPVFRLGLVALLAKLPNVAAIVEAERAEQGLARWREGGFDLVTLDLSLPDGDGFSLLRQAREERLAGSVIVVSMHDDRAYPVRAKAEGAAGYAAKSAGASALVACVERVLAGAATFQTALPPVAASAAAVTRTVTAQSLEGLSPTERRVLALLGRSLTSREMAGVLGVSVRTVENHRANICRKLELRGPHRLLELALAAAPLLAHEASAD